MSHSCSAWRPLPAAADGAGPGGREGKGGSAPCGRGPLLCFVVPGACGMTLAVCVGGRATVQHVCASIRHRMCYIAVFRCVLFLVGSVHVGAPNTACPLAGYWAFAPVHTSRLRRVGRDRNCATVPMCCLFTPSFQVGFALCTLFMTPAFWSWASRVPCCRTPSPQHPPLAAVRQAERVMCVDVVTGLVCVSCSVCLDFPCLASQPASPHRRCDQQLVFWDWAAGVGDHVGCWVVLGNSGSVYCHLQTSRNSW